MLNKNLPIQTSKHLKKKGKSNKKSDIYLHAIEIVVVILGAGGRRHRAGALDTHRAALVAGPCEGVLNTPRSVDRARRQTVGVSGAFNMRAKKEMKET